MITASNNRQSLIMLQGGIVSAWRRSSWSGTNGNCVEVALLRGGNVGVRDSKDPHGQVLRFSPEAWRSFVFAVRAETRRG